MVGKLREVLDEVAACARAGDFAGAMRSVAEFTLLFEDFLQQNEGCIFGSEVAELNRCLARLMAFMEAGDLGGLVEVIDSDLRGFLDDWDFQNKQTN